MQRIKSYSIDELFVILGKVANGKRHSHYMRTVALAKFYRQMFDGEDLDEFVTSYKPRETEDQKKQRIAITKTRVKYVCNRAFKPFDEVPRVDNVTEEIKYAGESTDTTKAKIAEIYTRINDFYEGKSVKSYLNGRFKHFQAYDPNAFLVIEFWKEPNAKAWVYPLEVYSHQAVDFELQNGDLQYLAIEHAYQLLQKDGKTFDGKKYTLYAKDVALELRTLPEKDEFSLDEGFAIVTIPDAQGKEKNYAYRLYETMSKVCPAIRMGYIPDPKTGLQTYVSPLENAREVLLELINAKSEYDLSLALHGFYKVFQYLPACDAKNDSGMPCQNGMIGSNQCKTCKGSGYKVHTTSQEIIAYNMSADKAKEEHIPMSEMVHVVGIPIELMEMQRLRVAELEKDVSLAIFNSNIFERSEIAVTATEKRIELNSIYNVLSEYGNQYSEVCKKIYLLTAIHTQNDTDIIITHSFPSDFKLETLNELLLQRKEALLAGCGDAIIDQIDFAILQKQNVDDHVLIDKYRVEQSFMPFRGKTETERIAIIALLPDTNDEKMLYLYFDKIMLKAQQQEPLFYLMKRDKQETVIKEVINNLMI